MYAQGDTVVAFIAMDMTQRKVGATPTRGGPHFVWEGNPTAVVQRVREQVHLARQYAHLVFFVTHWGFNYDEEPSDEHRELAKRLIREAGIDGVLMLSGDTHYSALFKLPRTDSYPLHDLSCSPLTAGPHRHGFDRDNPRLVPGTYVAERNFCQLDVSGPKTDRTLRLSVINADGRTQWARDIHARDLTSKPAPAVQ